MTRRWRNWLVLLIAATPCVASADAVAISSPSGPCGQELAIPRNVTIGNKDLLSLISEMARRSPTFRQQLLTVGGAASIRAQYRTIGRLESPVVLAKTTFGRSKNGLLVADIQLPVGLVFAGRDIEFIAHETEHVIEQIEGVNLASLARKRGSGVYRIDMSGRPFETMRAQAAGHIVEREYHEHEALVSPCETVEADAGS